MDIVSANEVVKMHHVAFMLMDDHQWCDEGHCYVTLILQLKRETFIGIRVKGAHVKSTHTNRL